MARKAGLLIPVLTAVFLLTGCFRTCDCFDEFDDSFGFVVDLKSYGTGISIREFLSSTDSAGRPRYYKIAVYDTDTSSFEPFFRWHGDGKSDSIVQYTVMFPPKKIIMHIDTIGLHHVFTDFHVEGFRKGRKDCKCFTPTRQSLRMDDSITLDVLNTAILFKKD